MRWRNKYFEGEEMIISLGIIWWAFAWLLYETHWLTIRLPYGEGALIRLTRVMIAILVGASLIAPEDKDEWLEVKE